MPVVPLSSTVPGLRRSGLREPASIGILGISTVHIPEKMLPAAR
jgi:hypothetical protein